MEDSQLLEAIKSLGGEIANGILTAQKNDPTSQTATWNTIYNTNGIYGAGGARPGMYDLTQRPINSFTSQLRLLPSRMNTETYELRTGYTAGTGTNASNVCADPPTVGRGKVCRQTIPFGEYKVKTEVTAVPNVGLVKDYSINERTILNPTTNASPFVPDMLQRMQNPSTDLGEQLMQVANRVEIDTDIVVATGDPAASGGDRTFGWITEFRGIDLWVKTGYVDSLTNLACPAADSVVESYGATLSSTIVTAIRNLYYSVFLRARGMGMPDVQFAFVGDYKLFYALVDVYACNYATARCTGNSALQLDAMFVETERLNMLNGEYLMVDGKRIPFLFLESFDEEAGPNDTFTSDLYILPMSWRGTPLTYLQYFPLNNAMVSELTALAPDIRVMNNGLWMMNVRSKSFCVEMEWFTRMRFVIDTPSLAGRLDSILYTFSPQSRDPIIGRTLYSNGGITSRN